LVEELELWRNASDGNPTAFRMLFRNMIKVFSKDEIKLVERKSAEYPYEAVVTINSITITSLVSVGVFNKYYPELVETEIDKLERKIAELKGVAST